MRYLFFNTLMLIAIGLSAQEFNSGDTVKISGKSESIFIPAKDKIQKEIDKIENDLKKDLEDYMLEMRNKRFISDNVITDLSLDIISTRNKPDLKLVYEYSLKNENEGFQSDDFALGKYNLENSNAATVTLSVIGETLNGMLSKFIYDGQKIDVMISGSADAAPIMSTLPYNGEFGEKIKEKCTFNGDVQKMEITKETGINTNPELAFMRSFTFRNYIQNEINSLENSRLSFEHIANVSDMRGGKYRRVKIEMVIYNAFKNVEY